MSASNVVAARFDYLFGTNLDLLFSVMKADRSSHSYSWDYVRPGADTIETDQTRVPERFGHMRFKNSGSYYSPVPSIPDIDIGWEFSVGLIWKLLENWHYTEGFLTGSLVNGSTTHVWTSRSQTGRNHLRKTISVSMRTGALTRFLESNYLWTQDCDLG